MKSYYQLVRHSGNYDLFRSVEMSIVAMANGHPFHIHAEGLRGTGKTTIMRAAREVLPPIVRIKDCIYNCDPQRPYCPDHRDLSSEEIAAIGVETVPRPFLEISHAAKLGTIVGSIDLKKLTDKSRPFAALLPGTIPQAHRGIIFIDEINRLADTSPELADVLLDVMGTKPGRIQIEETGLPTVSLPVDVTVWAASNPDEEPGALMQIRKQLADRFDVTLSMGRPVEYQSVLQILERRGPEPASKKAGLSKANFEMQLAAVRLDDQIRRLLANIYVDFGLESLRAVEGLETASSLAAVLAGRQAVSIKDVAQVTPLVLGHRTDHSTLTSILKYLQTLDGNSVIVPPVTNTAPRIVQNPPASPYNQSLENKSLFAQLWDEFKSLFSYQRKPPVTAPPQSNHSTLNQDNSRQSSSTGGGGAPQIMDPTNTPIMAPPKSAVPLADLPLEDYVTSGEDKLHGR